MRGNGFIFYSILFKEIEIEVEIEPIYRKSNVFH
jgi:hypothetical protein